MTTVVWDGKALAADKMLNADGMIRTTTKIRRAKDGALLFSSGYFSSQMAMMEWYERGQHIKDYPKWQDDEDSWVGFHVIKRGREGVEIWRYDNTPYPYKIEDMKIACGSGRDYAMGALAMGADARKAVSVACTLDPYSGCGIDILHLDGQ